MCVRGERMCTCVLGMLILPVSMIFQLDLRTVLTVWYFPIRFKNCSDSVVFSN